jgi:hypothetical protein
LVTSTPCTVRSVPLSSTVKAVPLTTGAASSTPATAATASATASGNAPPSPALTCSAARPAMPSTTSVKARMTSSFARSMAHTSATPHASAISVSDRRGSVARRKRSGMRSSTSAGPDRIGRGP